MIKSPPASAGNIGLIPGLGRSPGKGNCNPFQYSSLGNHIDRGTWWVTVHGVTRVKHYLVTKQQHVCVCVCIYRWLSGKELVCQCRRHKRHRFDPWVGKIPWKRKWQPIPVFLPGKFHGQRNLAGYSSWGHKRLRHDLATKQTTGFVTVS